MVIDEPVVEKELVFDQIIAPQSSLGFVVKKGQYLRVTDIEGKQVGDFIVINERNLKEHFDPYRTELGIACHTGELFSASPPGVVIGGVYFPSGVGIKLTTGTKLISNINNEMMTIVAETPVPRGIHHVCGGRCSSWTYERYGVSPRKGCLELFVDALKNWGFTKREDIPENMVIFMNVPVDPVTGLRYIEEPVTRPGDYIEFRAEMDCICALVACPDNDISKCNGAPPHPPKPLQVQIYNPK
jgi:hypothetical protein